MVNKKYMCRCGQEYYSDHGTPMGISWSDGHTCCPVLLGEDDETVKAGIKSAARNRNE